MEADAYADELVERLRSMDRGTYLLLCAAANGAGGELVLRPSDIAGSGMRDLPRMIVTTDERGVVVRMIPR